jgi:dTDP-4-dehydrorhamnose 3,5-epimerase
MKFHETKILGVFEICLEPHPDERGFFARTFCQKEFDDRGLNPKVVQCNTSRNTHKGTLRGMHFQEAPFSETKIVRCTRGAVYDVVVDLRPQSKTLKNWIAVTLTEETGNMVYIPDGCAHGFLTLTDGADVFYQMSEFYKPEAARGVRWNDPAFGIHWPADVKVISERDRTYPDFA